MIWFTLLVASLASARIIRLIVDDVILDRPRAWWTVNLPEFFSDLLACPYCVSGWITLPITAWAAHAGLAPTPVLWWFACWHLAIAWYMAVEWLNE